MCIKHGTRHFYSNLMMVGFVKICTLGTIITDVNEFSVHNL